MKHLESNCTTNTMWMSVEGLSSYLGLSKSTIYKKIMLRKIPYHKVEGTLFFNRESIDAWIEAGKIDTVPQSY